MSETPAFRLLVEVLERAQAEGALGSRPVLEVIEHARAFVQALPASVQTVVDLGSGAGIPGLVLALDRPELRVTLIDRRAKRTDALQRAVQVLGWSTQVTVVEGDAEHLGHDPAWHGSTDAVVARGFGPPHETLAIAKRFVRPAGWILVSEPPADHPSRWDVNTLARLSLTSPERLGAIARFHVEPLAPSVDR